jgi:hypothetical protein
MHLLFRFFWTLESLQIKAVLYIAILSIAKDMGNGVNTYGVRKAAEQPDSGPAEEMCIADLAIA